MRSTKRMRCISVVSRAIFGISLANPSLSAIGGAPIFSFFPSFSFSTIFPLIFPCLVRCNAGRRIPASSKAQTV